MNKNFTRWIPVIITLIFVTILTGVYIHKQNNPETISLEQAHSTTTESTGCIQDGKININIATEEELILLPGIGQTLAQRIVDYRTQNGPFRNLEDLKNVSGIGDVKFDAVSEFITVGQPD